MRKWMTASLLTVMASLLLSGCSGNNKNAAAPEAAVQEGSEGSGSPSALPVKTFTALLDNNATFPYSESWPVWRWLKEKTGVTLKVQTPSGSLKKASIWRLPPKPAGHPIYAEP